MNPYKPMYVSINTQPLWAYDPGSKKYPEISDLMMTTSEEIPYLDSIEYLHLQDAYQFNFWYQHHPAHYYVSAQIMEHSNAFDLPGELLIASYNIYSHPYPQHVAPNTTNLPPTHDAKKAETLRKARLDQITKVVDTFEKNKFAKKTPKPNTVSFPIYHHKDFPYKNYSYQKQPSPPITFQELYKELLEKEAKLLNAIYNQGSDHGSFGPNKPQPNTKSISEVSKELPGMKYVPTFQERRSIGCNCMPSKPQGLWGFIQHLNDNHKHSREKIAKWLDELHDSGKVNLEFEPWKEDTNAAAD